MHKFKILQFLSTPSCENFRILRQPLSTSVALLNSNKKKEYVIDLKKKRVVEELAKFQDTFGNLSAFKDRYDRYVEEDEDDIENDESKKPSGKKVYDYKEEITNLLSNFKYKEALKLLKEDMVYDRIGVQPQIYNLFFKYFSLNGNLVEAYKLYIAYRQRQGVMTRIAYKCLFETCKKHRNSAFALEKAHTIRKNLMKDNPENSTIYVYSQMLAAFGVHGDVKTCLQILDEMKEKKIGMLRENFNSLLKVCTRDKNAGLRYALLLWRRIIEDKIVPNSNTINILLICVRKCGLGDIDLIPDLIKSIAGKNYKVSNNDDNITHSLPSSSSEDDRIQSEESHSEEITTNPVNSLEKKKKGKEKVSSKENSLLISNLNDLGDTINENSGSFPNLFDIDPTPGSLTSYNIFGDPVSRFQLLGGVEGVLKMMIHFKIPPTPRLFKEFLLLLGPSKKAEETLIRVAEQITLPLEIDFYTSLLKRRHRRGELESKEEVLRHFQKTRLMPDLHFFKALALFCLTKEQGVELLDGMKKFGFRPTVDILLYLFHNARKSDDLTYVRHIIKVAKEEEVEVNAEFVSAIQHVIRTETFRGSIAPIRRDEIKKEEDDDDFDGMEEEKEDLEEEEEDIESASDRSKC